MAIAIYSVKKATVTARVEGVKTVFTADDFTGRKNAAAWIAEKLNVDIGAAIVENVETKLWNLVEILKTA